MAPKLKRFRIEVVQKRSEKEDTEDEEYEPLVQPFDIRANNLEEAFGVARAAWEVLMAGEALSIDLESLGAIRRRFVIELLNRLLIEIRHDSEFPHY